LNNFGYSVDQARLLATLLDFPDRRRTMAKAVIFDVDGTLVDSVDLHAHAWQDAFRDFGHEISFQEIRHQIGKGSDQLMPVFLSQGELNQRGEVLEKHRAQILKERYLPQVTAFPQVRELFQRLLADGKRVALASSAKEDELEKYKEAARIDDLIQAETSSDDAEKSKPHPDILEAAMQRLGDMRPEDAIIVGDTPYDAEAASKLGLRMIGLLCGGWSEEDLRRAGCIAVYQDPGDLLARYDEAPLAQDAGSG
jgi:HAD superfamily hydrolase (TIGR01549 family)